MRLLWLFIILLGAAPLPKKKSIRYKPEPLIPFEVQTREAAPPVPIQLAPPDSYPPELTLEPITADEAARLALNHQGNVTIAAHQIESQKGVTTVTRAPYFPNVSTSMTYLDNLVNNRSSGSNQVSATVSAANSSSSVNDTTGTSSSSGGIIGTGGVSVSNPVTVSASLRQLIWDFDRTRFQVAQSKELEAAAAANYTQVQYDTIYNVKNSYYNWVQADRLLAVYRGNMEAQRKHLAEAQARFRQGVALPSDVTAAQTNVSQAVLNVTAADVNVTIARTSLANQMGLDPRIPLRPSDSHEHTVQVADSQQLYQVALEKRPELAFAEAAIRANVFAVEAARRSNAPSIAANIQYVAFGNSFYPTQNTLNFLLTLSWNPFDGGVTAGRVKQAEESLIISRAQMENYRNQVIMEVSQAYANLRGAEQRVMTAELQVASADATVNIASARYRAGLGTFLELVDAQQAALQSAINRVNAQLNLEQTRAALNHALGVPLVEVKPPLPDQ
ncbi:TolC family protein [bacterium]|nr:TolC family protein [bacterium]